MALCTAPLEESRLGHVYPLIAHTDDNFTFGGFCYSPYEPGKRRFSGTARSEEPVYLVLLYVKRHVVNSLYQPTHDGIEVLLDVAHLDLVGLP